MVEVEYVPFAEGPMLVAALRREGVDAVMTEAFDPVTTVTRARVFVRRSDAPAALDALQRLR